MRTSSVAKVLNIDEMRSLAQRRLPPAIFDAIEGGAGDELSVAGNQDAFGRLWFRPKALADISSRDLSTTVLGQRVSMPLLLDPCGMARMMHPDAELAIARAAAAARTTYVVSTAASYPLEDIARESDGLLWYQLYLPADRGEAAELVDRAYAAGYRVLCVNIDSPISPKRERDYRNGLSVPLRMNPRMLRMGMARPAWSMRFLLGGRGGDYSFYSARAAYQKLATTIANFHPVTLEDLEWLRERWPGTLAIKGVQRGDECAQMVEAGVTGIVLSNHGGRNLDGAIAPLDLLPEVVGAVEGRAEVFIDGGIRRGTDVVKALALGARACLIGRAYLYGLSVAGESGVRQVLEIFRSEIDAAMALLGLRGPEEIDATAITTDDLLAAGVSAAISPHRLRQT